jgi:hypothetical protein
VVTRSGTNQWHGDAFEFIRNNYIDATNFFSASKDQLHMDQFGGTFGGRIIRDKLFGFAGYQRYTSKQLQSSSSAYVPTADNLAGNFSITDPITKSQLVDPVTWSTTITPVQQALTGLRRRTHKRKPWTHSFPARQAVPPQTTASPRTPQPAETALCTMQFLSN